MREKIAAILESLKNSDLEGAKKQIEVQLQTVKNDRDKGGLTAASGILSTMSKGKEGTLQTWDHEKIARAADTIRKSQMSDDWDQGYADVLGSYAKLLQKKA